MGWEFWTPLPPLQPCRSPGLSQPGQESQLCLLAEDRPGEAHRCLFTACSLKNKSLSPLERGQSGWLDAPLCIYGEALEGAVWKVPACWEVGKQLGLFDSDFVQRSRALNFLINWATSKRTNSTINLSNRGITKTSKLLTKQLYQDQSKIKGYHSGYKQLLRYQLYTRFSSLHDILNLILIKSLVLIKATWKHDSCKANKYLSITLCLLSSQIQKLVCHIKNR